MSDVLPARLDLECGDKEPSEAIPIQFNLHSCYYNDFFLLRTLIVVNGTPAEIKIDPSGTSRIQHSESGIDYPLSSLVPGVAITLSENHRVYHIDTFCHKQVALFSVVFPSQSGLRKFLESKEKVESDLAELFSTQFKTVPMASQQTPVQANERLVSGQDQSGQESQLQVSINAELFLASPARSTEQEGQPPEVRKVTLATFEHFIEKWQQSKLFDFDSNVFSDEVLSQHPSQQGKTTIRYQITVPRRHTHTLVYLDVYCNYLALSARHTYHITPNCTAPIYTLYTISNSKWVDSIP